MRELLLCLTALLSLLFSVPSAATTWVERRLPDTVSDEALAKVEQGAQELRSLLAGGEEKLLSLPDEPGEDCHRLLTALDEGWNAYVRTMECWGCIDESRDWMKPYWRGQVCLYGRQYGFFGLPLPEEPMLPKPLLEAIISLMRAELEGSQQEHLDYVRHLQELQEPASWEAEDASSPYDLPPLLP